MEPQQEIRPMELQYRQGLITQRPPYVNYTETQEQQLAGMRQRRATINQELRYIDEQLRQIPTSGVLGSGDQVLRQTYEAQKARLMREREALVNQLRGVTEDTSTRVAVAPGRSVPVPSTSVLAVPFQTQPGQMTTPELVLREVPAAAPAGVRPDMMRLDGTTKSARGFLGPITNNISGKTMTELSVGSPGSPEGYYPLLVPTLTQDEIRTLQNLNIGTDPIPPSILRKAKAHADQRTAQGLSPFYQDGEATAAPATTAPPKQQKAQEELVRATQSVPMGEGAAPEKLADTVAAATGGIMYGADPKDFDPQATDFAVQQSLQMRQRLVESYNIAAQYGFPGKADEIYAQIQAIDLGLYKAQGEMGVYEGVGSGNWSRAVTTLSQFKGIPHQVLDRQDGTYDLYINGRVSEVAQSPAQLADYFRYQLDEGYRAQKAKIAGEQVAQQNEIDKIVTKAVLDAQGNMQVALINAQKELTKQGMADDAQKLTLDPSGIAYMQENGYLSIVDPRGMVQKIAGQEVTFPTTTRVPGFGG